MAGLRLNVEERGVRERSGVENWEIEVEEGETSAWEISKVGAGRGRGE